MIFVTCIGIYSDISSNVLSDSRVKTDLSECMQQNTCYNVSSYTKLHVIITYMNKAAEIVPSDVMQEKVYM